MVDKNIRLKGKNKTNDGFDNLFPQTKSDLVLCKDKTLTQVLDETTAQLAQKADLAETTAQFQQTSGRIDTIMVNGTPTEGNTTLLDGAVSAVGTNNGTVGTNIRKTQTGEAILSDAINEDHISFLKNTGNVFNKDAPIIPNGYYSAIGYWTDSSAYFTSLQKIEPNKILNPSFSERLHVVYFDTDMNFISSQSNGSWEKIITPNRLDVAIMALSFPTGKDLSTIMIGEWSTNPSDYIPYQFTMSEAVKISDKHLSEIRDGLLSNDEIDLSVVSKNLFNKDGVETGKEIYNNGTIKIEQDSAVSKIEVPWGTENLYISGLPIYSTGLTRYVFFYDKANVPIGSGATISNLSSEKLISVPTNANHLMFSVYQRKNSAETINLNTVQVESGVAKTSYEPYVEGVTAIMGKPLANSRTAPSAKTKGLTGLFFGDSITKTATVTTDGSMYTEGTRQNWPVHAKNMLQLGAMWNYAESGAAYKNRGATDERLKITHQIETAIINNRPADIIVVSAGTNDGDTMIGDYTTAMGKATLDQLDITVLYEAIRKSFWRLRQAYPNAKCFVATPIQRADKEQPIALIEAISKMAKRYNFIIIDAFNESGIVRDFEIVGGQGRDLYDGLHPSVTGQTKMAQLYSSVILNHFNY